jgi:hypothetical protein
MPLMFISIGRDEIEASKWTSDMCLHARRSRPRPVQLYVGPRRLRRGGGRRRRTPPTTGRGRTNPVTPARYMPIERNRTVRSTTLRILSIVPARHTPRRTLLRCRVRLHVAIFAGKKTEPSPPHVAGRERFYYLAHNTQFNYGIKSFTKTRNKTNCTYKQIVR